MLPRCCPHGLEAAPKAASLCERRIDSRRVRLFPIGACRRTVVAEAIALPFGRARVYAGFALAIAVAKEERSFDTFGFTLRAEASERRARGRSASPGI